jgi:hypothetical protein
LHQWIACQPCFDEIGQRQMFQLVVQFLPKRIIGILA